MVNNCIHIGACDSALMHVLSLACVLMVYDLIGYFRCDALTATYLGVVRVAMLVCGFSGFHRISHALSHFQFSSPPFHHITAFEA